MIDLKPPKKLPNGKRPAPKHSRGMCMKCYMAWNRKHNLKHELVCTNCDKTFRTHTPTHTTCSKQCASEVGAKAAAIRNASKRGELRSDINIALAAGDNTGVILAIRGRCIVDDQGCWLWQGRLSDGGYPSASARPGPGRKNVAVHRLVLEAKHGKPLGTQHAHHVCAVPSCVNPDHLAPVTHAQNVAEMMARQSYIARIAELEDALRHVDPHHPILNRIECA